MAAVKPIKSNLPSTCSKLKGGLKQPANNDHRAAKKKKKVRLKTVAEERMDRPDVFANHWLVDSPRKIVLEKTTLGLDTTSSLVASLEQFYDEVAFIPQNELEAGELKAKRLMVGLLPKCAKHGQRIGLKITKAVYPGSTSDGTQVIDASNVDVFILFEFPEKDVEVESLEAGYRMIPLPKHFEKDDGPPDPWRFGRSADGMHLSPMVINENLYEIIERSLQWHRHAVVEPFKIEEGRAPICVRWEGHNIHITPAVFLQSEDVFLITRPYRFDEHIDSDMRWRMSFAMKERKILRLMDRTDRGIRRKAFMAFKALVAVEHTLKGFYSYQLKTILFHCFDRDIDHTPKWQRGTVETAFVTYLQELYHCLKVKNLPHFYVRGSNLLANVDDKLLHNLTQRVAYLVNNPREIVRILKKRPRSEEEEDILPLISYSRDSSIVTFATTQPPLPGRTPGTQLTLLGSVSGSEDETNSPVPKGKDVKFARGHTVIHSSPSLSTIVESDDNASQRLGAGSQTEFVRWGANSGFSVDSKTSAGRSSVQSNRNDSRLSQRKSP